MLLCEIALQCSRHRALGLVDAGLDPPDRHSCFIARGLSKCSKCRIVLQASRGEHYRIHSIALDSVRSRSQTACTESGLEHERSIEGRQRKFNVRRHVAVDKEEVDKERLARQRVRETWGRQGGNPAFEHGGLVAGSPLRNEEVDQKRLSVPEVLPESEALVARQGLVITCFEKWSDLLTRRCEAEPLAINPEIDVGSRPRRYSLDGPGMQPGSCHQTADDNHMPPELREGASQIIKASSEQPVGRSGYAEDDAFSQ